MLKRGGYLVGFEAKGHAGYAEEGHDIVCSAVSALVQTVLLGLSERLQLPLEQFMEPGDMRVQLSNDCTAEQLEQAAILLDTLQLGIRSMALGYGEYLKLTQREV